MENIENKSSRKVEKVTYVAEIVLGDYDPFTDIYEPLVKYVGDELQLNRAEARDVNINGVDASVTTYAVLEIEVEADTKKELEAKISTIKEILPKDMWEEEIHERYHFNGWTSSSRLK